LNEQRVQCPVGLSTLKFGRQKSGDKNPRQPYCYMACGHVHGLVEWGDQGTGGEKQCTLCRQISKCVPLVVGQERKGEIIRKFLFFRIQN
jgi:pellino protein